MPPNPYQSLVSLLSNAVEAYTTAFFITDFKNRTLRLAAVQSLSRHILQDRPLPLEEGGIISQVQKVGQVVHMNKIQESSPSITTTLPLYREGESHIKGLFAMPLAQGAGVLYVDTKYQWGFSDKNMKLIHEMAIVLENLLAREASHEEQKDSARILGFCSRVKRPPAEPFDMEEYSTQFLEECAQLLDVEYAFLALRDPDDDLYQLFAATLNSPRSLANQNFLIKHGLLGHAFQTGKVLHIARLNPHASEHFLFSPSEGLPHHGTLWAIPADLASDHQIVLAFLSRDSKKWNSAQQEAILQTLHFYQLLLDRLFLEEECRHLKHSDPLTGLPNPAVFERRLDQLLEVALQHSLPLTFALVQFNPWPMLLTGATPKQIRRLQKDLAEGLKAALMPEASVGQLAENRFGIIFPGLTAQQVKNHLSQLAQFGEDFFSSRLKGIRIRPQLAWVSFPHDGTGSDDLWPLAYHRLYAASRSKMHEMNI